MCGLGGPRLNLAFYRRGRALGEVAAWLGRCSGALVGCGPGGRGETLHFTGAAAHLVKSLRGWGAALGRLCGRVQT